MTTDTDNEQLTLKSFGNWALGYEWVSVGGTTGLKLYARQTGRNGEHKEPKRRIVFSHKQAADFLIDVAKVPQRFSGKLMAQATSDNDFTAVGP